MSNLESLEKKINSEFGTKIKDSKINHGQIYITINPEELLDTTLLTLMFLSCVGLVAFVGILIYGTLSYLVDLATQV